MNSRKPQLLFLLVPIALAHLRNCSMRPVAPHFTAQADILGQNAYRFGASLPDPGKIGH
ncbi:MAG: hypothetical protein IPH31_23385 [Lewinellaceae bacterium]|nr:hypothetical protein [Lewinellaceae bacterium]